MVPLRGKIFRALHLYHSVVKMKCPENFRGRIIGPKKFPPIPTKIYESDSMLSFQAREGPPRDLRVEPEGQRSANVEWLKPITSEQPPIGYELYYIKADAKIWEDDLASLGDW